jgi:hypothetical protein
MNVERIRRMHFSSANDATGRDDGRPSKKKQPYIPPKATALTPDQAEEELKANAAPLSQEFEACSELIAEARKRQELGQDSRGRSELHRADVA